MPISKSGKTYFTQEQEAIAKQASALEYARQHGYNLKKQGRYFGLEGHSSMVFTQDGRWFWNAKGAEASGRAIAFIKFYENKSYKEAVLELAGDTCLHHSTSYTPSPNQSPYLPKEAPAERQELLLPERNDTHRRVFAYLTQTRGIQSRLVSQLMHEKLLYESKEYHNAVFVQLDCHGEPKGAFMRGTTQQSTYKGMAPGSDRLESAFRFGGGKTASILCVFEAAIDALSYATIQMEWGNKKLDERYYLATGGAGDSNVMAFLKSHPQVKSILLCQDNDTAGHKFADELGRKLRALDYDIKRVAPHGKDYNEDLLSYQKQCAEQAHEECCQGARMKGQVRNCAKRISATISALYSHLRRFLAKLIFAG